MSGNFRSVLYVFLLIPVLQTLAQDTIPADVDDRYREDQFYVGLSYNFVTDIPSDMKISGLTGGFRFGFIRDMPINKQRNVAIGVGVGLAFDRYGQNLFIGEDENTGSTLFTVLNEDIDYKSNRLSTASIEAPIEFRWRSSTAESYRFWRIYAGFRVEYVYWHASVYRVDGATNTFNNIPEFEDFQYGISLSFGYNTFNFYGYYSLSPFFSNAVTTNGQGVKFQAVKLGLMFDIL